VSQSFSNATLILIGHGSTKNAGSAGPVQQHAAELRRRGIFADVREAFWKQEPGLHDAISNLQTTRVFFIPLFISEGYFSENVIPHELGFRAEGQGSFNRHLTRSAQAWFYCQPVGTHPGMTDVLLARARNVVTQFPFPRAPKTKDITLFVAGHGTEQDENSRKSIDAQVTKIKSSGLYADVQAIFMEEEPRINECYRLAQTKNIIVVPFFMSDGLHVQEDIPVLLGEPERIVKQRLQNGQPTWRNPTGRHDKLVWYAPAVGTEPGLAEVILERVREADGSG
jgi:sirohydrochlorin cobaltochelatase